MMSDHFIGDSFNFKLIEEVFKMMGFTYGMDPKGEQLDNKTRRILNRLSEYLGKHPNISLRELFKEDIKTQIVKVKGQKEVKVFRSLC